MTQSLPASFRPGARPSERPAGRSERHSYAGSNAVGVLLRELEPDTGASGVGEPSVGRSRARRGHRYREPSGLDWTRGPAKSRQSPWSAEDLIRWLVLWVIGAIMLVVGWFLASSRATLQAQLVPVDIAIAGAILVCMANVLWLLSGRRAVGERMRQLLAPVGELAYARLLLAGQPISKAGDAERLVAGDGLHHFHRETCVMASGRNWPAFHLSDEGAADRVPCSVCLPIP